MREAFTPIDEDSGHATSLRKEGFVPYPSDASSGVTHLTPRHESFEMQSIVKAMKSLRCNDLDAVATTNNSEASDHRQHWGQTDMSPLRPLRSVRPNRDSALAIYTGTEEYSLPRPIPIHERRPAPIRRSASPIVTLPDSPPESPCIPHAL